MYWHYDFLQNFENFLGIQCEGRLVRMHTRSCLVEQTVEGIYQLKLEQQHVERRGD